MSTCLSEQSRKSYKKCKRRKMAIISVKEQMLTQESPKECNSEEKCAKSDRMTSRYFCVFRTVCFRSRENRHVNNE